MSLSVLTTPLKPEPPLGNFVAPRAISIPAASINVTSARYKPLTRSAGNPMSTIDPMDNLATLRYDADNNLVSQLREGELTDVPGDSANVRLAETTYVYDAMSRLVREEREFFDPATQAPIGSGQSVTETLYTPNSQKSPNSQRSASLP